MCVASSQPALSNTILSGSGSWRDSPGPVGCRNRGRPSTGAAKAHRPSGDNDDGCPVPRWTGVAPALRKYVSYDAVARSPISILLPSSATQDAVEFVRSETSTGCLLYTSDAADERSSVD